MEQEWRPHRKQAEFLALPTSIKEACYGGGAGSAKTETLLYYPIARKWHEMPGFKQVFMRRTFPELRNEVLPRSRQIYRRFGAEFNQQSMCWTFPSGAMVFLGHCENEDDVHKYDSMEINLYTPDEITSFTEWIYLYIGFQRTRAKLGSGLPSVIRAAGMPGGIGHSWVKKRFVDPFPKGGKVLLGRGGNKRIYIHATLADNPHIDPNYAQSLEALPEAEKQAKKYGSWDAYLGQVFEEFRDRQYPDEPSNALHVVEPFEIPEWWPKIIALDWGMRAMTWIGFGAISPTKRLYVYRELHWKNKKIEEWAPILKQFIEKENPRLIKVCQSAGQDRGQEHTIQQQIESAIGRPVELTQNSAGSRIAGKMLLHEYFRWKPRPVFQREQAVFNEVHAQWLLRNKGMDEYQTYLKSFVPIEPEDNLPKVQIFNTCPTLITTIKSCIYAKPKAGKAPEDVAEFDGDDPYDGFRYLVDCADRYFNESAKEFEKVQQEEQMVRLFNETKDWNIIYQKARAAESSSSKSVAVRKVKGFRRYH